MRYTDIIIHENSMLCDLYNTEEIPGKRHKTQPNQGAWKQNVITRIGEFKRHIKRES
jgi:hypothetical protein